MDGSGNTQREVALFTLANTQHGLLRREQLIAAGLSQDAIDSRAERRRLARVHPGVYAFGHTALRDEGRWLAAQWSCDPGAVLSHLTAAAFHRMRLPDGLDDAIHLSTTLSRKRRGGVVVHRVRHLDRIDVHRVHDLRVTTIPRTLVDLADLLDWRAFRAVADAQHSLRVDKIREAQGRASKRVGRGRVTRLIEADDAHTRSEFERRFLRFVASRRLPRPDALNVRLAGHRADCVYLDRRLVVELDGRAFHRRRAQMRADRQRDTDYQLERYRIMRLVWDDVHPDEAARTADRLQQLLEL